MKSPPGQGTRPARGGFSWVSCRPRAPTRAPASDCPLGITDFRLGIEVAIPTPQGGKAATRLAPALGVRQPSGALPPKSPQSRILNPQSSIRLATVYWHPCRPRALTRAQASRFPPIPGHTGVSLSLLGQSESPSTNCKPFSCREFCNCRENPIVC